MSFTFKSVYFEISRLLFIMSVGLIQSVEGDNRKRLISPREAEIWPADGP